jgi:hypothetical protein
MMIECKSPSVALDDTVLHQLLRYHLSVPTGLLVITNGEYSHAWEKKDGRLHALEQLPDWEVGNNSVPGVGATPEP